MSIILSWGVPATSAQDSFVLTGQLHQGTPDGEPLPESLPLELSILSPSGNPVETLTTTSSGTSFSFESVPAYPDHFYIVKTTWAGLEQSSFPVKYEGLAEVLDFPLYEITDQLNDVVANRGNIRVETTEVGVQMLMELEYINVGNRIVIGNADNYPVTIELPVGAFGIAPEESGGEVQRLQVIEQLGELPIPAIADTQPLVPQWANLIRVSWLLPYEDGAVVDIRFPFAVTDMGIFVREDNLSIESTIFTLTDQRETTSGRTYRLYEQNEALSAGQPFKFTLLGRPVPPPAASEGDESSNTFLFIFAFGALLIFVTLMMWFVRVRQKENKLA